MSSLSLHHLVPFKTTTVVHANNKENHLSSYDVSSSAQFVFLLFSSSSFFRIIIDGLLANVESGALLPPSVMTQQFAQSVDPTRSVSEVETQHWQHRGDLHCYTSSLQGFTFNVKLHGDKDGDAV